MTSRQGNRSAWRVLRVHNAHARAFWDKDMTMMAGGAAQPDSNKKLLPQKRKRFIPIAEEFGTLTPPRTPLCCLRARSTRCPWLG